MPIATSDFLRQVFDFTNGAMKVGSQSDPATHAAVVTPADDAGLTIAARALFIGAGGDLKVTTTGGETVAFVGLTSGMILPVAVSKVFATGQAGTIASNIVALY